LLRAAVVDRQAGGDGVEPGRKAIAGVVALETVEGAQERLLGQVFGVLLAAGLAAQKTHQARSEATGQGVEALGPAAQGLGDELLGGELVGGLHGRRRHRGMGASEHRREAADQSILMDPLMPASLMRRLISFSSSSRRPESRFPLRLM